MDEMDKEVKCMVSNTKGIDVFIGSSTEGLDIAEKVKKYLSGKVNCKIWSDNFFDINVSTLDLLCKKLIGFDFAVFIGKKDDLIKTI